MPEISIIIPNWNGKHLLHDCLSSLRRQIYSDFETILVDNGSTDGSAEFVRLQFPEVRLIALSQNLGFVGGTIAGYEQSTGSLVTLLNNDTEVHPQWLKEIYEASRTYPDAGSFDSKMMFFHERDRIENCGFELGTAGATVDLGRGELDGPEWSRVLKVFGGCGGAVAYRRQMLEDVGFLDPDFVMIYEDVDLSFRAQLRGYPCVYLPRAIVYHRYRVTIGRAPARQVYYSQRNIEYLYLKNMPLWLMLRSAPQRLLYEIGAAAYFCSQGTGSAFFRAKFDVLVSLPSVFRKRRFIQQRRKITNSSLRAILRKSLWLNKWSKFRAMWSRPTEGEHTIKRAI